MRESDRLSRHPRAHNTQWQLLALAWMLKLTPFSWVLAISASTPTFCHSCNHSMQTDPTMIDRLGNVRLVRNTIIFSEQGLLSSAYSNDIVYLDSAPQAPVCWYKVLFDRLWYGQGYLITRKIV